MTQPARADGSTQYLTRIRKLLIEHFSEGELRTLCADLHIDYEILPGEGKADKTLEIIKYLYRRGRVAELVELCMRERNHISWQETPTEKLTVASLPQQTVQTGLSALIDLLKSPGVRNIVVTFRTDFQATREQVNILAYFKDLHDLLHTLQYKCYNPLVREARTFPGDEVTRENLVDYELTLGEIHQELADIVAHSPVVGQTTAWIDELAQAAQIMHQAIATDATHLLKQAIWLINRVLANQPSYINANLIATARTLPLPRLIQALVHLREQLVQLHLDPVKLRQFEAGVRVLASRNQTLLALVNDHDAWQAVDRELRRIDASLPQDITELEMSWEYVKAKVWALCGTSTEAWATTLSDEGKALESDLATHDPSRVRQSFLRYHRQASNRFYRVDTSLKRLCDSLREFRDPLTELQRMLDE